MVPKNSLSQLSSVQSLRNTRIMLYVSTNSIQEVSVGPECEVSEKSSPIFYSLLLPVDA